MKVKISVPGVIRQQVGGVDEFETDATTVGEAVDSLVAAYPGIRDYLFSTGNRLRNFINLYVNDEDVRTAQGFDTKLKDGDMVVIVPSVAGGSEDGQQLSTKELLRYDRHLIMPEVGVDGQKKLKSSSVLVVGMGGLGTPAATYLAAAGVGHIGIIDFDSVEFSNLHRQVLYGEDDVGKPKVEVAKARLKAINPNVRIDPISEKLDSSNALEVLRDYDIILDGTDNFPTRYLVNDACVLLGKPNVYASIFRFEGQVSVFIAGRGPCYRCLYPEPPPPGLVPSCAEGGVFGVLPSVVGSLQAVETIKLILGVGEPLIGRLLLYDALKMRFRELKLRRDDSCPVCGNEPTIRGLIDYQEFCGVGRELEDSSEEVDVETLYAWLNNGKKVELLDVRELHEYEYCKLPGAKHIPLGELRNRIGELNSDDTIVAYCHTGERSLAAARFLATKGFKRVKNLRGGIDAWSRRIDQKVPRY